MSSELKKRIVSAIVLAILALWATWMGGVAFDTLSAVIMIAIYYEWSTITGLASKDFGSFAFGWFAIGLLAINLIFGDAGLGVPLLAGLSVTSLLLMYFRRGSGWLPGGILYAGLSGISLSAIRGNDDPGLVAMIYVFAIVWATDILAYFVGRAIGGKKLAPRISPGKTWSGAIGGTVSGVIAGGAVSFSFFPQLTFRTLGLALLLSVASQIGDLFESFIKRRFGVKDSSHLIPGHGGVMDRVDGLVFAGFTAFLLAIIHAAWSDAGGTSVAAFVFGL